MNKDVLYIKIIDSLKEEDYELRNTYNSLHECVCAVSLIQRCGGLPDVCRKNGNFYFRDKSGILPFYMAREIENSRIELYEITYKKYCELGF